LVYSTKGQTPTQEKGQDLTLRQYIFFGDAVYGIRGRGFKVQIRVEADLFSKNYDFYFSIASSEINLQSIQVLPHRQHCMSFKKVKVL